MAAADRITIAEAKADLSPTEAAVLLGMSVSTLYRRLATGDGPPSYTVGRVRRFNRAKLERWRKNGGAAR